MSWFLGCFAEVFRKTPAPGWGPQGHHFPVWGCWQAMLLCGLHRDLLGAPSLMACWENYLTQSVQNIRSVLGSSLFFPAVWSTLWGKGCYFLPLWVHSSAQNGAQWTWLYDEGTKSRSSFRCLSRPAGNILPPPPRKSSTDGVVESQTAWVPFLVSMLPPSSISGMLLTSSGLCFPPI